MTLKLSIWLDVPRMVMTHSESHRHDECTAHLGNLSVEFFIPQKKKRESLICCSLAMDGRSISAQRYCLSRWRGADSVRELAIPIW